MEQIVSHKGVWCKVVAHGWKVREWSSARTGQREVQAYRRKLYIPLADIDDPALQVNEIDQSGTLVDEERKARARECARQRSFSRAARRCRLKIKNHNLRQLLTGTYRENMGDFDRVRKDFAAWLRIMRKLIPNFRAVFAFEKQKRGAWHWHAAIDKMPARIEFKGCMVRSYDLVRRIWVSVVGHDNGTVKVDGHNKTKLGTPARWSLPQSLAKIAGYVSKYLTKAIGDGLEGRNMWGSTQGMDEVPPVVTELPEMPLTDVIELAFRVHAGERIVRHTVGRYGDSWLLFTEPDELRPLSSVFAL